MRQHVKIANFLQAPKTLCFVFFTLVILHISCRHDPFQDFPDAGYGCLAQYLTPVTPMRDTAYNCCNCVWDWQELISSAIPYDYLNPCLNPNNNNQLAYYRVDNTMPGFNGYEIWVDDFCTKEKKLIATNALHSIEWGRNGWVLYTGTDQNFYKVKANGDSLELIKSIPPAEYNRYPKFSPKGDKVLYQSATNTGTYLFVFQWDENTPVDTVIKDQSRGIIAWNWVDDTTISYVSWASTFQLTIMNLKTKSTRILYEYTTDHSIDSFAISTAILPVENSILWCGVGIVGKINLTTGNTEIILKRFPEEFFLDITVLQNGTDFLLNKRIRHQIDNCTVDSNFDFYLVNSSGTKFNKLNLLE